MNIKELIKQYNIAMQHVYIFRLRAERKRKLLKIEEYQKMNKK